MAQQLFQTPDVDAEARFRSSFQSAFVGIAHVALDGRWIRVNETLCALVGYSADELQSMTFQDITHPDDLDKDLQMLACLSAGEIDHYRLEKRYFRKTGEVVWVDLQVAPQHDASGHLRYYIASVLDITNAKATEEQLRQATRDIENLLHVMAHELRGPLNNISLKAQMIYRLSQQQQAQDKIGECAAAIIKQVGISGEFLGYLQTMAPAQSVAKDPEAVPLYEVIEQVLIDSHVRLTQTQTTVRLPSDLPTVWGYRVPLIHIMQNLIDNSIKYRRPEQGCTITISSETRKDRVLLAIQDNGRGIPTTERDLVFEPARRASNVGQTPGHGLGLAFCQKLMTAMGGSIRHAPTASEGARFELWFRTDKGRGKRASVLTLQK